MNGGLTFVPLSDVPQPDRDQVIAEFEDLLDRGWPVFMGQDPVEVAHQHRMFEDFAAHQIAVYDTAGRLVAGANSVPLRFDGAPSELPQQGWDWALSTAVEGFDAGVKPNVCSAIAITLDPEHRRGGLSRLVLEAMRNRTAELGYRDLFGPLRPTAKHLRPDDTMEQYAARRRDDGLPEDPWLRVHVRAGAEVLHVCAESMRICAPVATWAEWGVDLDGDGFHRVPGGVVDVEVRDGVGYYVEPNIWIHHRV